MTVEKKPHGGARRNAGAKSQYGVPMSRKQVMLDEKTVTHAVQMGRGNLSAGLREAVRIAITVAN